MSEILKNCSRADEPMCETSEEGEKCFSKDELLLKTLEVGQRILEVFGYQDISEIIFRLKSTRKEIDAVMSGERLPSTELLLAIQKATGTSIDWLLAGVGDKYSFDVQKPIIEKSNISRPIEPARVVDGRSRSKLHANQQAIKI